MIIIWWGITTFGKTNDYNGVLHRNIKLFNAFSTSEHKIIYV